MSSSVLIPDPVHRPILSSPQSLADMGNPLYPGDGSSSSSSSSAIASTSAAPSKPGLRGGSFVSSSSSSKSYRPANEYDPSFHPGLLNLGNTCFLNSVLQAIGNTRDFRLLIQGTPVSSTYSEEPPSLASSRQSQWPNRAQSPALRISDGEHGRRIDHPPSHNLSLDSSLASLATLPAHDPIATIKPSKAPLPPPAPKSEASTSHYEPDVLDLPLNTAFRHVLEKFWNDGHKSRNSHNINPKRLLNQLGKKYDQYLEYGQQDGHELMRHLLDACRMEELDVIKKMRPPPPNKKAKIDDSSTSAAGLTPADMVSLPSAAQTEEDLLPFLDLLFCGKLTSVVVCEGCKKVSHTYEDFYDISLSLRDEVNNPKSRKRDRLRSMADRWRKATQGRTIMDRKAAAAATAATPIGTPRYSENEASDADNNALQPKKSAGFLSPEEGGRGRFALRTRSLRKSSGRHEKLGATSGSEMEPDFPDMASLSLAPSGVSRPYVDSAPASAGEDNGDARTGTRVARMLGSVNASLGDASSRETSPNPSGDRAAALMRPPLRAIKSTSHQSAYIARIMADDPATSAASPAAVSRKAGIAPSPLLEAASAQGKPVHGFFRSAGAAARTRDPCADFEPDPKSQGAKRRQKVREEQSSTGLIASLRQFTSVEVLDGENSFACKNCWRLANPPTAQEREAIRRRRRRQGVAAAGNDDEEESEPSSSEGEGSDRENSKRSSALQESADATLTSNPIGNGVGGGAEMTQSTSQSTLASSSVDSILTGSSASQPNLVRSDIPTFSMTSPDASMDGADVTRQRSGSGSANGGSSVVARDYGAGASPGATSNGGTGVVMQQKLSSESSLSSVEGGGKPVAVVSHNRDRLDPHNGYDTGTETDMSGFSTGMDESNASTDGEGDSQPAGATRSGPKRSAQSLPRRALKRYLIASAPPVLIFHLKRFQATGRGFVSGLAGFKKIDDQVTFPEYLDITPWLAPPREEYDRRGRLKASSDPLAIRRRAEEEAIHAGVDARNVNVEVSRRGHRKGERKGKRHGMWSWHLSDRAQHHNGASSGGGRGSGDLEEGPKVHNATGHEIVPSVIRRPKTEYRLYAVIVHQGSLSAGHYTAYVLSDRIKLKEGQKELIARSAPTSRTNTPAPPTSVTSPTAAPSNGLGQFFRPPRNTASPAPIPRPASAAPAATMPSSASMTMSMSSMTTATSASGSSSHDIAPQTSISSLDTDTSQRSLSASGSASAGESVETGPKLVRPTPQLKTMASWDSLDELEQSHAAGVATPTANGASGSSPLEPTKAVPTVASHNSNAHRHVEEGKVEDAEDDVDPRKVDDGRRWVYTSDTIVRAATIDEVLKAKAYMLFYERI